MSCVPLFFLVLSCSFLFFLVLSCNGRMAPFLPRQRTSVTAESFDHTAFALHFALLSRQLQRSRTHPSFVEPTQLMRLQVIEDYPKLFLKSPSCHLARLVHTPKEQVCRRDKCSRVQSIPIRVRSETHFQWKNLASWLWQQL